MRGLFLPGFGLRQSARSLPPETAGAFKVTGMSQLIPVKSDGALEKLRQATGQESTQVVLVGLIPPGEEAAQIEQFTVP